MAIQDTTGYIRVKHTGLIPGVIYLKDLDGEANRGTDSKQRCVFFAAMGGIRYRLTGSLRMRRVAFGYL